MPLIRNLSQCADALYFLSRNALNYAVNQYNIEISKCKVARLGVDCSEAKLTALPLAKKIKLVSVSSCTHVKRINKIIDRVDKLSE